MELNRSVNEGTPSTEEPVHDGHAVLTRKNLIRGGATGVLGAAVAFAGAARSNAAPTPPKARGRFVEQNDPRVNVVINVRAWGAMGDGTTDDTQAIQASFDAAKMGETVLFPEGTYRVTTMLTHAGSLGIVGMGQGLSRIDWGGQGDAITLTFSTPKRDRLVLKGFTVNAIEAGAGTAISAIWTAPAAQGWPHAAIEDVEITRGDGKGQSWQRGIYLEAAWVTSIRTLLFLSSANTGIGLEIEGQSVDCNVTDFQAQSCETGILLGSATEGTVIDNAVILDAVHGVRNNVNDKGRKGPWVTVSNSHMNTRSSGVILRGTGDSWIINNLFYKFPPSDTDYTAVGLDTCRLTTVRGNEIFNLSPQPTTNVGVQVTDSAEMTVEGNTTINLLKGFGVEVSNSPDAVVLGNRNRNVTVGIRIGEGTERSMVAHNIFRVTDSSAVPDAVPLTDEGQDNLVESNAHWTTG